jgi:hypothetical protein
MSKAPSGKSGRAYIAHDKLVSVVRMYFQMATVGVVLGCLVYSAGMAALLSYYIAGPIPEIRIVNGSVRLLVTSMSRRLPLLPMLKYFVSLNPGNYIRVRQGSGAELENVEQELQPLFQRPKVPREAYRQAIWLITRGRIEKLRWIAPVSLLFFPVFGVSYFVLFRKLNQKASRVTFVRGIDLTPLPVLKGRLEEAIREENSNGFTAARLQLGPVRLPHKVARTHALILGTPGTGKSVSLNNYIVTLNRFKATTAHSAKAVIYDAKGEFAGKHFSKADVIFYPFDTRSIPWNFFNEVMDYPDLDILSTSIYEPPRDTKEPYWYNAARDVFRTGLFYLLKTDRKTNRDIWEFFCQPVGTIREAFQNLPIREAGAIKHIDKTDSNQAASVISILQERLTFFRYLTDSDGPFSFRQFIRDESDRRNLFLMNMREYDAIFKPLMTFVVDLMTREVLSLPDSYTRRITFLIDEIGSLSKMPSIFDFLTMARSKGGFLTVANQDLGAIADIYGSDKKDTFFNNFNLHLAFRINDPTTSEFLSKAFGEREVIKKFQSSQFSPTDLGDRFSMSDQEKLEKVILPTEFQNLRDFHAYIKIANYGLAKVITARRYLSPIQPEFLKRDFRLEDMLKEPGPDPESIRKQQPAARPFRLAP